MLYFLPTLFRVSFLFPATKEDTTNCWKQENLCALGTSQIAFKVTNVAGFCRKVWTDGRGGRLTKKRNQQTRAKNISSANKPKCQLTSFLSFSFISQQEAGIFHALVFGQLPAASTFSSATPTHTPTVPPRPGGVALDDSALEFIAVSTWKSAVFSLRGFLFSTLAFVQKLSP